MHYYVKDKYAADMHARIRELEEQLASAELGFDVAWDEVERGRGREQRLCLVIFGLGTVAVVAIMKASWLAMG